MNVCAGAPILFWLQDLWPESLSATGAVKSIAVLKPVELMVRWMYKWFDRILIQSRAFGPAVEHLGGNPNQIRYFPNGADSLYRPVTVPANAPEHELMPDGFRITFAGNIGAAQDFDTIIAAASLLKDKTDIHWIILGDGRMRNTVRRSLIRNGLETNVHLLGRYPPERMPYFFALSDALLVTLRKDPIFSLTIPSKVQSYLACGRPILAALDGEGARVIESAKAGYTCPTQDPEKLAGIVLSMFQLSDTKRREMGNRGRLLFEREFERELLLNSLERWLEEVASKR
jgi:glycosyltransferase involved in cell wall biosynthesis